MRIKCDAQHTVHQDCFVMRCTHCASGLGEDNLIKCSSVNVLERNGFVRGWGGAGYGMVWYGMAGYGYGYGGWWYPAGLECITR